MAERPKRSNIGRSQKAQFRFLSKRPRLASMLADVLAKKVGFEARFENFEFLGALLEEL